MAEKVNSGVATDFLGHGIRVVGGMKRKGGKEMGAERRIERFAFIRPKQTREAHLKRLAKCA